MESFFEELLDRSVMPDFLEKVQKKYHYQKEQLAELRRVAEEMLPLMRREGCWSHQIYRGTLSDGKFSEGVALEGPTSDWRPEDRENTYSEVLMTLGEGPDLLQEQYAARGLLTECYMVESLAGELLLKGYAAYNRYVASTTKLHVARYHFPGGEENFPIEGLPGMLKRLKLPVRCNEAFCMIPKKSVAFVAELTADASRHCQGICVGCTSEGCPNRMEEGLQLVSYNGNFAGLSVQSR